jgi:hypothetical protein
LLEEINNTSSSINSSITKLDAETEEERVKEGVVNGTIPYGVKDSGAPSTYGKSGDPFEPTNRKLTKTFHMPTGNETPAGDISLLHHDLCDPARTVDMVPGIKNNTLISTSKFADANYISIFDQEEVNAYDANTTKITVSRGSVLKGWRDRDGLW